MAEPNYGKALADAFHEMTQQAMGDEASEDMRARILAALTNAAAFSGYLAVCNFAAYASDQKDPATREFVWAAALALSPPEYRPDVERFLKALRDE